MYFTSARRQQRFWRFEPSTSLSPVINNILLDQCYCLHFYYLYKHVLFGVGYYPTNSLDGTLHPTFWALSLIICIWGISLDIVIAFTDMENLVSESLGVTNQALGCIVNLLFYGIRSTFYGCYQQSTYRSVLPNWECFVKMRASLLFS